MENRTNFSLQTPKLFDVLCVAPTTFNRIKIAHNERMASQLDWFGFQKNGEIVFCTVFMGLKCKFVGGKKQRATNNNDSKTDIDEIICHNGCYFVSISTCQRVPALITVRNKIVYIRFFQTICHPARSFSLFPSLSLSR